MKEEKKLFYGWWIVLGSVIVSATIVPSVMAMANKFLIPVTEDLGINRSSFALSNSILQAMGIFLSPYITKKLSEGDLKKRQVISILIFGLVFATYGFATKAIHLYITSFILGVCFLNAGVIPISIMITNWFEKSRGLAMSIAMSGIGVGGFIFSPLITKWISAYGWRKAYFIYGGVMLVIALPLAILLFKKNPAEMGLKPYGADEEVEGEEKQAKPEEVELNLSVKDSFKKGFFITLVIGMILNGLINTGALGQYPPALEGLHGAVTAAKVISIYSLVGIAGKLLLGSISDKFGIVAGIVFGTSMFGLSFVLMLFSGSVAVAYIMAIVFGLGNAIGSVMPPLLTSAVYGSKDYGSVYGYISSATQLGLTFGSLLVASIFDSTGDYRIAWIVMTGLTALTMVFWIYSYKSSLKYRKK